MIHRRIVPLVLALAFTLVAPGFIAAGATAQGTPVAASRISIVAGGLTNPRGFTWGPDGTLYVALAGSGGPRAAAIAGTPTGFSGGTNASVVAIKNGCPATVAGGLPSTELTAFGWVWGAMDVAFLDGQLYVLVGGGGPVHGNPTTPSGVYRVNADGTTDLVADLGTWVDTHPVAALPPEGFPNGGSWFAMVAGKDTLWVSDAVNGQILGVTPAGQVSRLADLSRGHLVPDGLAVAPDGSLYVGYETAQPFHNGASKVSRIATDGTVTDVWTGLTAVTGVAVAPDGTLYAAEMATANTDAPPFIHPGTGKIVRQTGPAAAADVTTDLDFPVALRFGPDGKLYVAFPAFGANHGEGAIGRVVTAASSPATAPATPAAGATCMAGTPTS